MTLPCSLFICINYHYLLFCFVIASKSNKGVYQVCYNEAYKSRKNKDCCSRKSTYTSMDKTSDIVIF